MDMKSRKSALLRAAAGVGVALLIAAPVLASHSWSNYHWARSTAELGVNTGDNVDVNWDGYLDMAITDWNKSSVIESIEVAGGTNPKNCKPVSGTIQVCNSKYGRTGWLGIAQIWISNGHITQGITKLNDTYFNTTTYNTPAWRALVMCQEIGHDYGLGHQDEDFNTDNTTSCMDYTSVPEGNEHPDQHDYEQLETIYNHLESSGGTTSASAGQGYSEAAGGDTPAEWGRAIDYTADGRAHVFERVIAPGRRMITHVFWAHGHGPRRGGTH